MASVAAPANNSDHEDFVSFPTLPDPNSEHNNTLSTIFTKTLRKVTNNATNLVQSYSPKAHDLSESLHSQQSDTPNRASTFPSNPAEPKPSRTAKDLQDVTDMLRDPKPAPPVLQVASESEQKKPDNSSAVTINTSGGIGSAVPAVDDLPRVRTDAKSLLFSNGPSVPKLQPHALSGSVTSSVVNVNAIASTETDAVNPPDKSTSASSEDHKPQDSSKDSKPSGKALRTKISNIFNNLPNDIELSEDSASDLDTLNDASINSAPSHGSLPNKSGSIPPPELYMYSDSVVKSSPIRAQSHKDNRTNESSTTLNSFNALKNYSTTAMRKKPSSNLSSAILDNAKSIINHNFSGAITSASSLYENKAKKKRRKHKKVSENPLKSGGIPKKYWMNDSFVSECLNCFKPFSAFRRKHHCRFCGQIFCSECTLFVSYTQHKEERRSGALLSARKHYSDKLRVCKPCYSDVIVYLSDSDSSSSKSDAEDTVSVNTVDKLKSEEFLPHHPLARVRTLSMSSNARDDVKSFSHKTSGSELKVLERLPSNSSPILKTPLQLSIPTTRVGESVEIPLSRSVHNNASFLNTGGTTIPTSYEAANKPWLKKLPSARRGATPLSSSLPQSGSVDSISYLNSGGKLSRMMTQADDGGHKLRNKSSMDLEMSDSDYNEDEFESENEDEQVMSLYTSLNHNGYANAPASSTISPRAPMSRSLVSGSTGVVPTLGEFPTMMVNEKLFPRSGHPPKGSTLLPKFIENGSHSHSYNDNIPEHDNNSPLARNAAFLEENPKSNLRSHERAHASLLRMRSRRKAKTVRNVSLLTQNNAKLPLLDFSDVKESVSPLSSPTSPSPSTANYLNTNSDDTIIQHMSNGGILSGNLDGFDPTMNVMSDPTTGGDFNDITGSKSIVLQNSKSSLLIGERKLDEVYDDIFDKILNQCFNDCDVKEDTEKWSVTFKRVLSNVDDIRMTDTLDIKQYVKFKRIAGGAIDKTDIIDGIYITKNIDSKRMPTSIKSPKIALLMFPIEYLKQKEQFISLRIVQSQQSVYITNLVSRLISLGPDVIVVGDSVCQLAENLLEEANITVISNTKPQVIERISRYTKADIFQSVNDLFFKKGSLGSCGLFEVKRSVYGAVVKTFVCFTGTDKRLGITIALRGGNDDVLNSIKYAAETLLPLQINTKLEKSYFRDQFLVYLDDKPHEKVESVLTTLEDIKREAKEVDIKCGIVLDENEVVNYVELFMKRYISVSPASKFCFPSQLYNVLEAFINYHKFYKSNQHLLQTESIDNVDAEFMEEMRLHLDIDILPNNKEDLLMFMKVACDAKLKLLQTQYQFRARTWSNYMKLPSYQLYPLFHRSIHVLYSNVSIKNNTPCTGPKIFVIDYYTDNDKCLGLHLDQMFGDAGNDCEECGDLLVHHYRNYVHGDGKIDMVLEKYDSIPEQHLNLANQRVMWSVCKECGYTSPVVPMKDSTYYYSLGKFFEVCFWGKNSYLNSKCDCRHDFFKSHIRYFGFNDMAIKVQYTPIENYEILVPKKQIEYDVGIDINLKIETFETVRAKISRFFQSVSNRLNRVKVDTFDQAEDGAKQIAELKQQLEKQVSWINEKTMKIYSSTPATSYLPLNSILRELQELGVAWDTQFNEFEAKFLPSENDITRITQFHLRNFLIDRYSDEEHKDIDKIKKTLKPAEPEPEKGSTDETRYLPKTGYDPNSNVGRKVSQMEALLEQERQELLNDKKSEERKINGTPTKTSTSTTPTLNHKASQMSLASDYSNASLRWGKTQNKVTQLTSFFDQMSFDQISQEFRKQRERELQKNLNKYRAIPIVASKPVVEIYNKIEDVVDNNEDMEIEKKDKSAMKRPTDISRQDTKSDEVLKSIALAKQEDDNALQQIIKDSEKEKEKTQDKDKLAEELPQPEKVSLLKSLTNFWADRSASLWDPLEYPLDSTEHTFADSDIIVREDEPSSLVALCLSTNDYKQKIKSLSDEFDAENDKLVSNEVTNKKINSFAKIERKFKARFDNAKKPSELETVMTKNKSTHLKYQFVDGTTVFSCKIFYSEQFEALRKSCGKVDKFIQSMSRCIKWNSTGGKSGSNFLKTSDNRYIVKELSKSELESFVSMAPFYFKYISQSMFNTLSTALAKIFGIYQVNIKSTITGKVFKMDFLIMENLFYNLKTTRIFDLKGSMSNRHVTQTGREDEVLLDENMIEYIYESPVFVKEHAKKLLRGSLFNDTSFLSAMDVMDYSLIIGINDSTKKLNIGIIDWLRTFTWDKKVENWVKGNNLIGGGKKGKDPTIVTPKQYRIRFREAMERYILEVPDIWYEGSKAV